MVRFPHSLQLVQVFGAHAAHVFLEHGEELKRTLEQPEIKQRFNSAGGLEPFVTSSDEFNALIKRDYEKYGRVVKEVGIKLD